VVNGVRGIEYAGLLQGNSYRGMHGSFSPRDVHNVLIAAGPGFPARLQGHASTGNVDLAPTVGAASWASRFRAPTGVRCSRAMEGPAPGD